MKEKHKDLKNTHQKAIVNEVVAALNELTPSFYYLPTIEVAAEIKKYIHESGNISREKFDEVKDLSRHDIQILLSLHN